MTKYNEEFKKMVVNQYLNKEGGYHVLAKRHGLSSAAMVRRWVDAFESQGYDGLKVSKKNNKYSFDFKKNVVQLYLTGQESYQTIALKMKVNKELVGSWVRKHREDGFDGLKSYEERTSDMAKRVKRPSFEFEAQYTREEIDEIKKLKEKIYWIEMENDFLKKKIALREMNNQETKKKRE